MVSAIADTFFARAKKELYGVNLSCPPGDVIRLETKETEGRKDHNEQKNYRSS